MNVQSKLRTIKVGNLELVSITSLSKAMDTVRATDGHS
jgi:hypothetical protein